MKEALNRTNKKRLGELLLEKSLISQEQLDQAIEEQKSRGNSRIGEILVVTCPLASVHLLSYNKAILL
jgi:hypothetical protein